MRKILALALVALFMSASGAAYAQQGQGFGLQAGLEGLVPWWSGEGAGLVTGQPCPYGQPLDGSGVGPGDGTQPQPRDGTGFGSPWSQ